VSVRRKDTARRLTSVTFDDPCPGPPLPSLLKAGRDEATALSVEQSNWDWPAEQLADCAGARHGEACSITAPNCGHPTPLHRHCGTVPASNSLATARGRPLWPLPPRSSLIYIVLPAARSRPIRRARPSYRGGNREHLLALVGHVSLGPGSVYGMVSCGRIVPKNHDEIGCRASVGFPKLVLQDTEDPTENPHERLKS
jgi:hypothetical protein